MTDGKSRRRGAELETAILDAAWAELSEHGYGRLTMEGVAARAGTSKPVLYRRWSSRAELALAAWNSRVPVEVEVADTGVLREDLVVLFDRIARRAGTMVNGVIAGVMAEAFRHPEMAELLRERLANPTGLTDAVRQIVDRAVERGELRPLELPHRAARAPLDLVRNEFIACGGPVDDDVIAALVDEVYLPLLRGLGVD
ncbi:TetR/AcrR family transcriptional regulator [Saccharothrix variisporea]|uniref:TetR family transcriptional regulator n=1 Tax=Saccharothrix variisporea TaxID=543527 RepID=A0A495X3Q8_9PSEU|nr:TetR/AcrR family transcriptional regulator [Saccharothrix variisporea]RKT67263.1 TetR family transcriptional regulator [Saccharothrix variisporea]